MHITIKHRNKRIYEIQNHQYYHRPYLNNTSQIRETKLIGAPTEL